MTATSSHPEPTVAERALATNLRRDFAFLSNDLIDDLIARALASQRADVVARYEAVAAVLVKEAGRYDDGDHRCDIRLSAAKYIREAAPK